MVNLKDFTPTQQRILGLLQDGCPHHKLEVLKCIEDDMAELSTLWVHITNIRKTLNPQGEDIVCVFRKRTTWYQWVRLLRHDE